MSRPIALVVDTDAALRALMRRALESAGYEVVEASGQADLTESLLLARLALAGRVLVVSTHSIALACREALTTAARRRVDAGSSPVSLLLTCELGTVDRCPVLEPPGCVSAGLLEKPFDFESLAVPFNGVGVAAV